MKIKSKMVVYNHDNVSTDQILPGPFLYIKDPKEMATHAMQGADPTLRERFDKVGKILVAGSNFGCGSSREYAVSVLQGSGVQAVVVKSAARIWHRNAINLNLPVLFCKDLPDAAKEGDEVEIDFDAATVRETTGGKVYQGEKIDPYILNMYKEGGLKAIMRKKSQARDKAENGTQEAAHA